jgi:hypothetical protein
VSELLVLEFTSSDASKLYTDVNGTLGVDAATGKGDWPPGIQSHVAGLDGSSMIVVELWDSRAAQEKFMAERLGPALGQAGAPQPGRVQWFSLLGEKK